MKMNTLKCLALVALMISLTSCGIFHKGCTCPHFTMRTAPSSGKTLRAQV